MKHVGKMSNNGARVVVVYRTLPGDPYSALVVGTGNLGDSYHNSLMSLVESQSGQDTNELAEILSVRKFQDGSNMLEWLHVRGHLKKVPTNLVIMTPSTQNHVPLNELNVMIAEQRGVSIDQLAISDGKSVDAKNDAAKTTSMSVSGNVDDITLQSDSPDELRSRADKLFKEAQLLRKKADELDPPKKKTKAVKITEE